MESVSKIRLWILQEGRSIRSVARATGLSRNTIKTYLKDDSPPSYQRQAPQARHKLCDGFDTRLQELFEQDQKRACRERRTAVKLYEQLVSEGYTGSYSQVQRFVRDLKRAGAGSGEVMYQRPISPRNVSILGPERRAICAACSKPRSTAWQMLLPCWRARQAVGLRAIFARRSRSRAPSDAAQGTGSAICYDFSRSVPFMMTPRKRFHSSPRLILGIRS